MTEQTEDDDDGSATFKMIAKVRNNDDPVDSVAIIDEASLVSNVYSESEFFRSGSGHLLRDLIAHVGSTHSGNARKIIFIGDPAQLPPVGMSTSPALDADYLGETFGLDAASYELTEIVRQKAESAVIRNVMPLREGVTSGRFSSLNFSFDDDVIQLPKDSVTPLYMKIREGRGPQAPIIVTHSNTEAANFNRAIRSVLFPGKASVAAGDSVIVAANGFCGPHYVANGEILRIDSVETTVERRSVLKIGFLPLSAQQREACFRRFFKSAPPSGLWALDQLAPGDFAVVAKRSKLLGITQPDAILGELRREQSAKPNTRNPIGFRAVS